MSLVILCDFDGTVVDINTCVFTLDKFAEGEWRIFDEQLERGEITLEQCLQKQFSTVRAPEKKILKELEPATSPRPNFEKLFGYCRAHGVPLVIVSAGMDFVIKHFLQLSGWDKLIEVYAPQAKCTADGIKFTFPKLRDKMSVNFKDDLVRYYKKQGKKVVYIGDGLPDYPSAKSADFAFAIKGSKLAELLKKNRIPCKEIGDFQEVVDILSMLDSLKHA